MGIYDNFNRVRALNLNNAPKLNEKKDIPLQGNTPTKKVVCNCKTHVKAKNFKELVSLVKDAEEIMIQNKLTELGDRINCLRGIYYGTIWSLDYAQEKSEARNKGFYLYTGLTDVKHDARKMLKCSDNCKAKLFEALYQSPEVIDSGSRVTDFGHLMIGLDARRSYIAKNANLPYGGTGLENVTWIGDIGGGAGMLAYKRTTNPNARAKKIVFDSDHDYGCSVNIEGDIAAYIVGLNYKDKDGWKDISNPTDELEYIYKGLEEYFDRTKGWTLRVNAFITQIGGNLENGVLTNKEDLLDDIVDSVEGFAQFYISLRAKDKSYNYKNLLKSFGYVESCSKEVSEIFLDGLLSLRTHPNSSKYVATKDLNPTLVDNSTIEDGIKNAEKIMDKIYKTFEELLKK